MDFNKHCSNVIMSKYSATNLLQRELADFTSIQQMFSKTVWLTLHQGTSPDGNITIHVY